MELEVKLISLKAIEARTEKGLEACKEQQYVKTKGGRRRYAEMVDLKHPGIVYEVKKKVPFNTTLEVLEVKEYVDSDESYNEEKDPERK